MKKTIICSFLEYILLSDAETVENNIVTLKDGKSWTRIKKTITIVYNSNSDNTDAGTLLTETLSINAYSDEVSDLLNSKKYYLVRIFTQDDTILMGSMNYPAKKSFNDNKKTASVNFQRVSSL